MDFSPQDKARRHRSIEIRQIDQSVQPALAQFFEMIAQTGLTTHFHPHAMSREEAAQIAEYQGPDLYYALLLADEILGYGMLRGWDEGYAIPSLGIVIAPKTQGLGLGRMFMHFLHAAARQRGATKVRLKVYADNQPALALYRQLGYEFIDKEAEQWVGYLDL
ncbi:MAG: GNAT family N-acetyltransferase [Caldilineales bacterium]|nr:GNAT family N-acetyltransferase [Caldilineales bacterium]